MQLVWRIEMMLCPSLLISRADNRYGGYKDSLPVLFTWPASSISGLNCQFPYTAGDQSLIMLLGGGGGAMQN